MIAATLQGSRSANARLNGGILTNMPPTLRIQERQEVSSVVLQQLAANTDHIIVGAFDLEGELIWSRR
jgi:hypothetical protein